MGIESKELFFPPKKTHRWLSIHEKILNTINHQGNANAIMAIIKMVMIWRKGKSCALLVEMKIGEATMEKQYGVSPES